MNCFPALIGGLWQQRWPMGVALATTMGHGCCPDACCSRNTCGALVWEYGAHPTIGVTGRGCGPAAWGWARQVAAADRPGRHWAGLRRWCWRRLRAGVGRLAQCDRDHPDFGALSNPRGRVPPERFRRSPPGQGTARTDIAGRRPHPWLSRSNSSAWERSMRRTTASSSLTPVPSGTGARSRKSGNITRSWSRRSSRSTPSAHSTGCRSAHSRPIRCAISSGSPGIGSGSMARTARTAPSRPVHKDRTRRRPSPPH